MTRVWNCQGVGMAACVASTSVSRWWTVPQVRGVAQKLTISQGPTVP